MIHDSGYAKSVKLIDLQKCRRVLSATNCDLMLTICTNLEYLRMTQCDRHVTDVFMRRLLLRCKALTNLCLSGNVTHAGMFNYQPRPTTLTHVDLSGLRTLPEAAYIALFESCSSLTTVNLSNSNVEDAVIQSLGPHRLSLTHLDLLACNNLTDDALMTLAQGCPRLTDLNLACCEGLSKAAVLTMLPGCAALTHLDLGVFGTGILDDNTVLTLAQQCKSLKYLDISSYTCTAGRIGPHWSLLVSAICYILHTYMQPLQATHTVLQRT